MANNHSEIERRLWASADELRAISKLKSSEYSVPVLGLIFLRYADHRFTQAEKELAGKGTGRRAIGKEDYQAKGVMFLPPQARFSRLLALPEGENIGKAINEAMKAVEAENEDLRGVLPKSYTKIENSTLVALLKNFSAIPVDAEGDTFGKIYEYFLGNFARAEGQKGGEFFTPTSLVKLIVQVIEPYHGRIYDPACGSGGMFVQSADFIKAHKHNPSVEISVYGQERVDETRQLCLMNLAVHALSGDIRQGNTYYEDLHESVGKFDFVMANPPFNVDKVDKEKIKDDPRFSLGIPRADNANYLWIQLSYSSLNSKGRSGFVMANSAADARQSELEIRKKLLQEHAVDVMVAIGPNFFYTVTLPCTLWFFDKGKVRRERKDQVLFIDARHTFRQVDRAHRKFSPKQIEYLANIVRLCRGEKPEFVAGEDDEVPGTEPDLKATFPKLKYADVAGLCKVATLGEIEAQGWSLNPGRYVGVADREEDAFFGYWPPTDIGVAGRVGMLWQWQNWQLNYNDSGYDVRAFTPTFATRIGWRDANLTIPYYGKGTGQLMVDYLDTSQDFWQLVGEHEPIAIMSFSGAQNDHRWELEGKARNLPRNTWGISIPWWDNTGIEHTETWTRPHAGGSANDFSPYKNQGTIAGNPPDRSQAANLTRNGLPMSLMNAIKAAIESDFPDPPGDIDPVIIDNTGIVGGFISEYMAYHVGWYRDYINSQFPNDPDKQCLFAGHTHVGLLVAADDAEQAVALQLAQLINFLP